MTTAERDLERHVDPENPQGPMLKERPLREPKAETSAKPKSGPTIPLRGPKPRKAAKKRS